MKIEKPIFIVGAGRSGTTIFYNLLSTHPEICWFSNYTDRFVYCKPLPLLHRALDMPLMGRIAKKNIMRNSGLKLNIRPTEAPRIYHEYCRFKHDGKTTEKDFNPETDKKFKGTIRRHLMLIGKKRFLSKQTANTQRIRLINEMFKDAYFIHIIRDGRAVSNSLLNVGWWNDIDIWWLGEKAPQWDAEGREKIELCGLHWKNNVEEILKNIALFEDRYLEIRYEAFVKDVRGAMKRVINFCELSHSKKFLEMLPPTLSDMNFKWKENLTEIQKAKLNETLKDILNQLNYN